jgi:ABC-type transporter Mla MlaB component
VRGAQREEDAVDCWIGVTTELNRRVVRVAGRLSVAQVPELLTACAAADPLEVDLNDVVSVDTAGIEALQRIREHGAALVGAPGYIQLKLDSTSGGPAAASPPPHRG